jgi:hypothetical protein
MHSMATGTWNGEKLRCGTFLHIGGKEVSQGHLGTCIRSLICMKVELDEEISENAYRSGISEDVTSATKAKVAPFVAPAVNKPIPASAFYGTKSSGAGKPA